MYLIMKKNQTRFLKLCLADSLLRLMKHETYESVSIHAICENAGVGRTTFYRHFDCKNGKEELLLFKLIYEWEIYTKENENIVKEDKGTALLNFIYNQKPLFLLIYEHDLIILIMKFLERISDKDWPQDKAASYLKSFFFYGWFGAIYQWIKYGFDETPEQVKKHILNAI